jgi:RNA polymerase sigma-70 factor (ECF subfamily)
LAAAQSSEVKVLREAELALAGACARGEAAALEQFEATYFGQVDAALAQSRNTTISRDELRQAMRHRLFVAEPGATPRIASYQGRGELRSWVRMAAARYLIDLVRSDSARPDRPSGDDRLAELATRADDPELAFLKQTYRGEFRTAFTEALATLEPRQRNMLRHRYLDGLEVAELATLYGVHRVSMSRALAKVRDELLSAIRRAFMRRLDVGRDELDSIMAMIGSQLELSLGGLLATRG